MDWKTHGRFNVDFETTHIMGALRGRQTEVGERIDYYRFAYADALGDDLYDEGTGAGKVFHGPFRVPALHVAHSQSPADDTTQGLYTVNNLHVTCSFDALRRMGFTDLDIDNQRYLTDRIVYDTKVFRVESAAILGQIKNRDIIVGLECVQLKADELVNDTQFAHWSQPVPPSGYGNGGYGVTPYGV
jgi:hypothetical protein